MKSFNGIIYAFSWYLDITCPDWDALVQGDYYRVMPLPKKTKYGISYVYQPPFTQQLGIFSTKILDPKTTKNFLVSIPKTFKLAHFNLNSFNKLENSNIHTQSNTTYQLDLIHPYEKIFNNFSTNVKRNIKKAVKNKVSVSVNTISPKQFTDLFRENVTAKQANFKKKYLFIVHKMISLALHHHFGEIFCAYTETNTLCAATLFVKSHQKAIYLLSVNTPEGRENSATFLIIDEFMRKNAERHLILDFEGSNIPNLARFYKSFGAKACTYLTVKLNRLPWPLKLIKK